LWFDSDWFWNIGITGLGIECQIGWIAYWENIDWVEIQQNCSQIWSIIDERIGLAITNLTTPSVGG